MNKTRKFKALTSVMLGASIIVGGMVTPALAANSTTTPVIESKIWDCKDHLTQQEKIPFKVGDIVIHGEGKYECTRFHYAQPGWNPCDSKMHWKLIDNIAKWNAQEELTQENKIPYKKGDMVIYNSKVYECRRFHYAQPGWKPGHSRMFWKLVK